jgi:hypothetical protein
MWQRPPKTSVGKDATKFCESYTRLQFDSSSALEEILYTCTSLSKHDDKLGFQGGRYWGSYLDSKSHIRIQI